jgi:hypothetical protein
MTVVTGGAEQLLHVTLHHAAGDARSLSIMLDELVLLARGEELAPLPYHFGDVAASWASRLRNEELEGDWEYWRDVLRPPLAPLDWGERPAATAPFASRALTRTLPVAAAERLGAAPFAGVAAALAAVLARTLGTGDVRIGTNVSTRTTAAMEGIIGPFVNTAILRLACERDPDSARLHAAARRALADALSHRELPLETVVARLRREGRTDLSDAAPVMLLVDDERASPLGGGRPAVEDEHPGVSFTASDVVIGVELRSQELVLSLVHREAACDTPRAAAVLDALAAELGGSC